MKKQLSKKFYSLILPLIIGLMFSSQINAQIVYTDLKPDITTSCLTSNCSDTINIDLNNDGNMDFILSYNRTYIGSCPVTGRQSPARSSVNWVVSAPGANSFFGILSSNPSALNYGNVIDSNLVWNTGADTLKYYIRPTCTSTNVSGNWNVTSDRYLPVKISISGDNYYGWIRMQIASISNIIVKDFAYNSIPNQPIKAGQTCPPKVVIANAHNALCEGDSLRLTANSGACGAASLKWSTGETTGSILVKTSGVYRVTLTDTAGNSTSDSVKVTINHLPPPTINASGATTFCLGSSITLTSESNGTNYFWSNKAKTKSITVSNAGNYTVAVTDTTGCARTSKAISVKVNPLPTVNPGLDVTIDRGISTVIGGFPTALGKAPFTYNWSPSTGLDFINIANPTATPLATRTYTVYVTDSNGCKNRGSMWVIVNQPTGIIETENGIGLLVFPNPANDLINITGEKIANGDYRFEIKNAFGQTMFAHKQKVSDHALQTQFSISDFSNGIYFLIVENGKSRSVIKVQKMN